MLPRQFCYFQNNPLPYHFQRTLLPPPSDDHIHFVPYGLIQYSSPECYRRQIIIDNMFLHKLVIIIIYNIDAEIMYSKILPSLEDDIRFKDVERTHTTELDGKRITIATKASKDATTLFIDKLIEQSNAPNTNPHK